MMTVAADRSLEFPPGLSLKVEDGLQPAAAA
jgi:hypothetical protein